MEYFSAQPSSGGYRQDPDMELAKELDGTLELVITQLRDILKNPHLTDKSASLQKLAEDILRLNGPSLRASLLRVEE